MQSQSQAARATQQEEFEEEDLSEEEKVYHKQAVLREKDFNKSIFKEDFNQESNLTKIRYEDDFNYLGEENMDFLTKQESIMLTLKAENEQLARSINRYYLFIMLLVGVLLVQYLASFFGGFEKVTGFSLHNFHHQCRSMVLETYNRYLPSDGL